MLLSVITVVRNGSETISHTIDSVRKQRDARFEHIIIDGASTDQTIDIVKSYHHDELRWISEPDLGIYDAMNKGIAMAHGEWILFLGADDELADRSVLSDIFFGQGISQYDLICGMSTYRNGRACIPRLDWHTLIFNTIHHQAVFYNRRLFSGFKYRTDIPVVADYELNLYAYLHRLPVLFLDRQISVSGIFGISHTSSKFGNCLDAYRIRRSYIGAVNNFLLLGMAIIDLIIVRVKKVLPNFG
jgi:glycosyltransferase involved in cell wall biosynthesis